MENKILRLKNIFILHILHLIYSIFQTTNMKFCEQNICFAGDYVQKHKESNKMPKQCISGFHG